MADDKKMNVSLEELDALVQERITRMIASGQIPTSAKVRVQQVGLKRPQLHYGRGATPAFIFEPFNTPEQWAEVQKQYRALKPQERSPFIAKLRRAFEQITTLGDARLRVALLKKLQELAAT